MNRRKFIRNSFGSGMAAVTLPLLGSDKLINKYDTGDIRVNYDILDAILDEPVFKRELFPGPVIIDTVELLRNGNSFICRVRSKDGAEGLSVSHSMMTRLYPIFEDLHIFFFDKDARDLDLIMERIFTFRLNDRMKGQAAGIPLAMIEFAVLDMMGHIVNKPIGQLIGDINNPRVPIYQATEYRDRPVEESVELIRRDLEASQAHAVKIKVGARLFGTTDLHAEGPLGRTEEIVPLMRDILGDDMILYADANGYYSVNEAIRIGKLLDDYGYGYFEEPVRFYWYEETKQVADALSMPVAGGEQEFTLHGFRWLIANDGLEVVQPNNYYFGGIIRSMRVARMAHAFGKRCTPHTSGGLGFLYAMHFISALPNAVEYHEYKGINTNIIYECESSSLSVENGSIKVPTGPGLGIEIDPNYIAQYEVISS